MSLISFFSKLGLAAWLGVSPAPTATQAPTGPLKTLHDFTVNDIDGKPLSLATFKGKKVLVVNVASECGYTPQYADLEKLYEKYKDKLVVIGFPANNFGGQEPGTNAAIKTFCTSKYAVTFPMMEKISVKGSDAAPLYKWLSNKAENGVQDGGPSWNFTKYLIDENGKLIARFGSGTKPLSEDITKLL
jgi:glutathione peroxidase